MIASLEKDKIRVDFTYSPRLVAAIKLIPGRKPHHRDGKFAYWTLPVTKETQAFLKNFKFKIEVDASAALEELEMLDFRRKLNSETLEHQKYPSYLDKYPFKIKPFEHQKVAMGLLIENENFAIFDEMGTGKSKVIVDTACWLFRHGKIEQVIIVCPNTVKGNWSDMVSGQIIQNVPEKMNFSVLQINAKTPISSTLRSRFQNDVTTCLDFVVINYEALRLERFFDYCVTCSKTMTTMLVLDESSKIKNRKAQQTKACLALAKHVSRRVILNGTPITKNPLDFWSQFQFLDERILGYPTFSSFQYRYAMMGGFQVHNRAVEIVGWQHLEELEEKVKGFSRRILKAECFDLPERIYTVREIALTEEQEKHYKEMNKNCITMFENGEALSASIVLTKNLRLQQITAGFLPFEDKIHYFENSKLEALMELLEETTEKVLVFCKFRAEIEAVAQRLQKENIVYVEIHGGISQEVRTQAIAVFQEKQAIRVCVCQIETGGYGITLTAAGLVVYMSSPYTYGQRRQTEDRVHRAGLKHNVTYVDFVSVTSKMKRTVDHIVLEMAMSEKYLSDVVLGDLKKVCYDI